MYRSENDIQILLLFHYGNDDAGRWSGMTTHDMTNIPERKISVLCATQWLMAVGGLDLH